MRPYPTPTFMRTWLFGCTGLVASTVLIGGATRLTNSGLSIVEWKPVAGVVPPLTHAQWEAEFEKYKVYPEFIQNPIDLAHFKYIYFYEWVHRVFARGVGFAFIVPFGYLLARKQMNWKMKSILSGVLAGYLSQGVLGWYMVKSGMSSELLEKKEKATVSAYRLTAHFMLAVALYSTLLTCAFRVPYAGRVALDRIGYNNRKVLQSTNAALVCVTLSLITGAATAGLDAGMIYNDFPYMGEGILPPLRELSTLQPHWRNLFENPSAAQVCHKFSALLSLGSIGVLSVVSANAACFSSIRSILRAIQFMSIAQVGLGISTLMTQVWIPLALLHQAGALVLIMKLVRLRSRFFGSLY